MEMFLMYERMILSERTEDRRVAEEWGQKQEELIKKGDEITQSLIKKYMSILLAQSLQNLFENKNE